LGMYKPQLFILFPIVLLFQRRWRALASFTVVSTALAAVSVALVGVNGIREWLNLLSSDFYVIGIADSGGWNMQSIAPILRRVAPQSAWQIIDGLILLAGIVVLAIVTRRVRAAGRPDSRIELHLYGFTILVTALVDPHFFIYDCSILVLPALLLISSKRVTDGTKVAVAALFLITMFATPLHLAASRLPAFVSVVDAQWSILPMLFLAWFTWKRLAEYWQGRPAFPASLQRRQEFV
jgi:hypothetical protein